MHYANIFTHTVRRHSKRTMHTKNTVKKTKQIKHINQFKYIGSTLSTLIKISTLITHINTNTDIKQKHTHNPH